MPPERSLRGYFIGFAWNPERDAILKSGREQGFSWIKCGALVGVSEHACRKRGRTLGLPQFIRAQPNNVVTWGGNNKTVWSDEERKKVAELYETGLGCGKIAKAIGKTKTAVKVELERQGVYEDDRGYAPVSLIERQLVARQIADDLKFQAAMRAAIKAGLERP
jgi:hypothetical protein